MKVKIAELGGIASAADAGRRVQDWIDAWVERTASPGGTYQLDEVDVRKESDGWYATFAKVPRLVSNRTGGGSN